MQTSGTIGKTLSSVHISSWTDETARDTLSISSLTYDHTEKDNNNDNARRSDLCTSSALPSLQGQVMAEPTCVSSPVLDSVKADTCDNYAHSSSRDSAPQHNSRHIVAYEHELLDAPALRSVSSSIVPGVCPIACDDNYSRRVSDSGMRFMDRSHPAPVCDAYTDRSTLTPMPDRKVCKDEDDAVGTGNHSDYIHTESHGSKWNDVCYGNGCGIDDETDAMRYPDRAEDGREVNGRTDDVTETRAELVGTPLTSCSLLQRTKRLNVSGFGMVQNHSDRPASSCCGSSHLSLRPSLSRSSTARSLTISPNGFTACLPLREPLGYSTASSAAHNASASCSGCSCSMRLVDIPGLMEGVASYCDVRTLVALMSSTGHALSERIRSDAVWGAVLREQMNLSALLQAARVGSDYLNYFVQYVVTTRALDGMYRFQLPSLTERYQQQHEQQRPSLAHYYNENNDPFSASSRSFDNEANAAQYGEEVFEHAALHLSSGLFGHTRHRVGRAQLLLRYTDGVTEVMHGCCRFSLTHRCFVVSCSVFAHEARGPMFFIDVLPQPRSSTPSSALQRTVELANHSTLFSASSSTLSLPSPHRVQPDRYADPFKLGECGEEAGEQEDYACDGNGKDDQDEGEQVGGDKDAHEELGAGSSMNRELDLILVLTPYARSLTPNSGSQITARHVLTVHRMH